MVLTFGVGAPFKRAGFEETSGLGQLDTGGARPHGFSSSSVARFA
jgi:hypothetical protein